MKGRIYDPTLGRFLQPDPIVEDDLNPQTWNRYTYVRNNPMTFTDPTGFATNLGPDENRQKCLDNPHCFIKEEPGDFISPQGLINFIAAGKITPSGSTTASTNNKASTPANGVCTNSMCHTTSGSGMPGEPMDPKKAGDLALGVLPYTGEATAIYELIMGKSLLSDQPQSRIWAGIGVLTGGYGKYGDELIEVAKSFRQLGRDGEAAVRGAHDIGDKVKLIINDRDRIPDGLHETARTLNEVKNVSTQALTRQLRDYLDHAQSIQFQFNLFMRPSTRVTAPLQDAIDKGLINRLDIPE